MKKALIIIVLGITLMFVGGVVTAFEIPQWTSYDLEENIADFSVQTYKESFNFEDLDTETIILESELFMMNNYDDYDDFDDFDLLGRHNRNLPEIVIDDSIKVGNFDVEMLYVDGSNGLSNCRFKTHYNRRSLDDDNEMWRHNYRNHKGESHKDHLKSLKSRKNGFFNFNDVQDEARATYDTVRIFPVCDFSTYGLFDATSNLKPSNIIEMLKRKQVPDLTHKITVKVNSEDAHRFYR